MRQFFVILSAVLSGLTATAQPGTSTPSSNSRLSRLYGSMPIDSSDAFVSAWCRANGFTDTKEATYPYLEKFRKTITGDARFDNIPDSLLTFVYFPTTGGVDSIAHIFPVLNLTLIYNQDASGAARKEFKALRKLFRKWTGNSARSNMNDRFGKFKKWEGYTSRIDYPSWIPMLSLNYSVSNQQPDRAEVTILYTRRSSR